jgi:hypothetical protein
MTTRQQVNVTAANVVKILNMMTRMSDEEIDALFSVDMVTDMCGASEYIVKKAEAMIATRDRLHRGNE